MNVNVRSQNSYFPLRSLPTVVIHHVAQYLTRRDVLNMAQVDTYFRDVFNSPQLWKDVRIRVPDKRIDGRALRIFRIRGIAALDIRNKHFELRQETTLQISHLETLSLHVTRVNTLRTLCQAASSGHLKLKNLAFGRIDDRIGRQSQITFLELFKNLTTMEGVSFGNDWTDCFPYEEGKTCVPLTKEVLTHLLWKVKAWSSYATDLPST